MGFSSLYCSVFPWSCVVLEVLVQVGRYEDRDRNRYRYVLMIPICSYLLSSTLGMISILIRRN